MSVSKEQRRAWQGLFDCGQPTRSPVLRSLSSVIHTDRDWSTSLLMSRKPTFAFFLKNNRNGFQVLKSSKYFLNLLTKVQICCEKKSDRSRVLLYGMLECFFIGGKGENFHLIGINCITTRGTMSSPCILACPYKHK